MEIEWLTNRITPEDLRGEPGGSRFWKPLLNAYREGDELWEFSTPKHSWENLAGRGGVALVRDGVIVDSIASIAAGCSPLRLSRTAGGNFMRPRRRETANHCA